MSQRPRGINATDSVVAPLAVSPSLRPSKVSFALPPSSLSPSFDATHESASPSIFPPSSSSSSSLPTSSARSPSVLSQLLFPPLRRRCRRCHSFLRLRLSPPVLPQALFSFPLFLLQLFLPLHRHSTSLLHLSSHLHRRSPSPIPPTSLPLALSLLFPLPLASFHPAPVLSATLLPSPPLPALLPTSPALEVLPLPLLPLPWLLPCSNPPTRLPLVPARPIYVSSAPPAPSTLAVICSGNKGLIKHHQSFNLRCQLLGPALPVSQSIGSPPICCPLQRCICSPFQLCQ